MASSVIIILAIVTCIVHGQNVPEIDSEAGQIERFDTLEGSRQWIDLGRPSAVSGQEGRKRVRREEDSNEDMSKYKKTSITKKPTSLVKSKPQLLPLKSTTTVPYSGGGVSSSSGFDHGDSGLVSASGSTVTGDGTSFFAPEDVTLPPNSTTDEDHHMYYNSTILNENDDVMKYWLNVHDSSVHEMLSSSHRRAATINLKFPFPFYGHPIKNITIATGGFLYLGETVHSWLAATQYIAPLMANFDTSIHNFSSIRYVNNETHFIVQWNHVELQDSTPPGNFSFQVTLKLNGDIIFVYHEIPFNISEIPDSKHPVKVGISDAYVIDRTVFFIRRKTIYEYHRADLKKENISNNTAIYFTALPTCVSFTNCDSCLNAKIAFDCKWCDSVQRCSDGFDRHRQDWLSRKCDSDAQSKDTPNKCKVAPPPVNNNSSISTYNTGGSPFNPSNLNPSAPWSSQGPGSSSYAKGAREEKDSSKVTSKESASSSKAGALFFLIMIAMIAGTGFWVFYAYKNPTTGAGQFLIKYRPAEWRWTNGPETRLMEIR